MSVKCLSEKQKKQTKEESYVPHKLRSRPFRCIVLPICCALLFIVYWFLLCPVVYHVVSKQCQTSSCKWPTEWPYYFWTVALLVFIIVVAIIVCVWRCKRTKELPDKVKERQKEYDKLLADAMDYNSLKKNDARKENKTVNERVLLKTITETNEVKPQPKKTDLEIETVKLREIKKEKIEKPEDATGLVEEFDRLWPRCSVRRKDYLRRPDSLVLQSPKYPNDAAKFRHTMVEETKSLSPLSPRDLFFFDLAKAAHEKTVKATRKFVENEKKHSSNNYDRSSKPEIKSFVLKQQVSVGSPEYFIANVSENRVSTSEVFMYVDGVDGGPPEKALTICYLDTDDEVFKE